MSNSNRMYWHSCSATHVGNVRQINEDALLDRTDICLWAVADGMGGHHAGDVASSHLTQSLDEIQPNERLSTFVNSVEDSILNSNKHLRNLAAEYDDHRTIGSTIMTMVGSDTHCVFLWAGDSRAYRSRKTALVQLTRDHSQVQEMIERGMIKKEDAESHPASNVITRAVGASNELFVDVDIEPLESGDTFLLCSDGLYKHITEDELAIFLAQNDLQTICDELINTTLERGAVDNVTVVVVRAEDKPD